MCPLGGDMTKVDIVEDGTIDESEKADLQRVLSNLEKDFPKIPASFSFENRLSLYFAASILALQNGLFAAFVGCLQTWKSLNR